MAVGIFAGSFDPFTVGHLDIVKRASGIFEEVYVAVLTNSKKTSVFTKDERVKQICNAVEDEEICNVSAISFEGLLVDCAKSVGATCTIRGVRSPTDFDYEYIMAQTNKYLCGELETVVLLARPEYLHISSSIVKELGIHSTSIKGLVPEINESIVAERLKEYGRKR